MKQPLKLFVLAIAVLVVATPVMAAGNVNFVLGARSVDTGEDELDEIEDQDAFGVNVDFGSGSFPFNWVIGAHGSTASEDFSVGGGSVDADVTLTEVSFGLGWTWGKSNWHPYVGGGVSYVSLNVELEASGGGQSFDFEEDDQSPAAYADGGIYWRLGSKFNLGVGARIVIGTDFDIEGESFDADYTQAHGVIGWGWD